MRSRNVPFYTFQCVCVILTISVSEAFYTPEMGMGGNNNNWAYNGQNYYLKHNQLLNPDASTDSSVCKEENGQFADPQYCDKYYDCWEGRPVSSGQCSHGLMFNEQTASCDYPANVNCDGKEVAQPLQDMDAGCDEAYGTFPNKDDCTQYTVCHAGMGVQYKCEEGLAFDNGLGMCTAPQEPSCLQPPPDDSPPEQEIPELPLDPESIKPAPPPSGAGGGDGDISFPIIPGVPPYMKCPMVASTGFIPIAKDCRSVLVCLNGVGYLFNCPTGEFFHPKEARCMPGKSENCEQLTFPVQMSLNLRDVRGVKYAYVKRGYPLLPI